MAIERKAELRRRQRRRRKMLKLRNKLRVATSNDEKNRILAKMMRINPFVFSQKDSLSTEELKDSSQTIKQQTSKTKKNLEDSPTKETTTQDST